MLRGWNDFQPLVFAPCDVSIVCDTTGTRANLTAARAARETAQRHTDPH